MKLSVLTYLLVTTPLVVMAQEPDLETTFTSLKQAVESKKDAATIKQLASQTHELASKDESERGKELVLYSEYALFAAALQSQPADTVDLLSTLEAQNPKSKYLDQAYERYFIALRQTGGAAKIPAIAEKALASLPDNLDALKVLADNALNKNQADRALGYGKRLVAAAGKKQKAEGVSDAEFQREKNLAMGYGYWVTGAVQAGKNQYFDADKNLRAALPLIQGNETMKGTALFYLGVANYQLGKTTLDKARVLEAAKFSEQAAAIKGPFQQQAWSNAQAMKTDAARMR